MERAVETKAGGKGIGLAIVGAIVVIALIAFFTIWNL